MPTYISLIPIVVGAGMCTAGDYHYTLPGLILTIGGVVLAALKVRPFPETPLSILIITLYGEERGKKFHPPLTFTAITRLDCDDKSVDDRLSCTAFYGAIVSDVTSGGYPVVPLCHALWRVADLCPEHVRPYP